jgi:TonB family protein
MEFIESCLTSIRARRAVLRLFQAAALALVVSFALPAHAAGNRAVQSRVAPVYPELAKRMKITGAVRVEATVTADGRVKDAKAVSGNHMLSPAAEAAVLRWKFDPADGESTVDVEVEFNVGM